MMFYASVFTGAVPAGASAATLLTLVLAVGVVALTWYGALALALSGPAVSAWFGRRRAVIERMCGVLLILLGARQLLGA